MEVYPSTDALLGQSQRVRTTFRDDLNGGLVDPDNVVYHFRAGPLAAVTLVSGVDAGATKVSPGIYDLVVTPTVAGGMAVREISTGTRPCSGLIRWNVYDPNF